MISVRGSTLSGVVEVESLSKSRLVGQWLATRSSCESCSDERDALFKFLETRHVSLELR